MPMATRVLAAALVAGGLLPRRCLAVNGSLAWPSEAALERARTRQRRLSAGGRASKECHKLLGAVDLEWLIEPFKCSSITRMPSVEMIFGTGVGDTGTRSVATAVDQLGYPTCHRTYETYLALKQSTRHDMSPFASSRAWFDTPMASIWPRLACAFPDHKIVHTTRAGYHRDYVSGNSRWRGKFCGPWTTEKEQARQVLRCVEYGTTCPTLADALAVFERVAAALAPLPPERVFVMNLTAGFDLGKLARFLGRAVPPEMTGIPHSTEYFCNKVDKPKHEHEHEHSGPLHK